MTMLRSDTPDAQKSHLQVIFTTALIVPFISQIVLAVGLVGWLSLRSGQQAVNEVASQLRQETVSRINQNLLSYLDTPKQINQANLDAINLGMLNIANSQPWNSYLWRQTKRSPSLNMIGFGNEEKTFIATDQMKDGKMLMMVADASTGYDLQIYALNVAGEREKLVKSTKNYDPRTRPWYQAVSQSQKPAWSPIFPHFSDPTLLIAHGVPVSDNQGRFQGVLANTIRLSQVGDFLQSLKVGKTGQTFILERSSGLLVASSKEVSLIKNNDKFQRVKAIESKDRVTQETTQYLANSFGSRLDISTPQQLDFAIANQKQFLQVLPFQDSAGIDWLIVVVVPEADFMAEVDAIKRSTILLCLAAAAIATLIGLITSQWLARPIIRLAAAARAVAGGSWDQALPIEREDELGILANAFHRMASKLQQSLAEVAEREGKLTEAQRVAHMGSWQFDLASQKFIWSEEMFRIYGLIPRAIAPTYEEAIQIVHPDDRVAVEQALQQVQETQQPFTIDYRLLDGRGEIRYVHGKGQPIWEQGQLVGILGTVMDISDRKQAEIALRTSEAELRTKTEQLESLVSQLRQTQTQLVQTEKMSSLGQMVAGIAHEINNPVSFIQGNITYAQEYTKDLLGLMQIVQEHEKDLPPAVQAAAKEIDADFLTLDLPKLMQSMQVGAERIQKIVVSLRNFSRLDESAVKSVDIHTGIDSTLMILQHRLKPEPTRPEIIVVRNYGQLPLVECYVGELNQVFMNLLGNAIDALISHFADHAQVIEGGNSPDPTIWITTESTSPNHITIRIRDNAGGVPEEYQSKLFDHFFTTKPVGKGTGLGLAISYQVIVEKHGGELKFNSQLNEGTEFIVTIPISQAK